MVRKEENSAEKMMQVLVGQTMSSAKLAKEKKANLKFKPNEWTVSRAAAAAGAGAGNGSDSKAKYRKESKNCTEEEEEGEKIWRQQALINYINWDHTAEQIINQSIDISSFWKAEEPNSLKLWSFFLLCCWCFCFHFVFLRSLTRPALAIHYSTGNFLPSINHRLLALFFYQKPLKKKAKNVLSHVMWYFGFYRVVSFCFIGFRSLLVSK